MYTGIKLFLSRRALALMTIVCLAASGCLASHTSADPLADRLSGRTLTDFTVVYNVKITDKLSGRSAERVTADVNKWEDSAEKLLGSSESVSNRRARIDELRIETQTTGSADHFTLVISASGKKLLVKQYWPQRKEVRTFLYDGERTLDTSRGYDAQIYPQFQYTYLRGFMFPGTSVCGLPLVKNLFPMPGQTGRYTGLIAAADGATEVGGLPQYRPGVVQTRNTSGVECITETHAGSTEVLAALHVKYPHGRFAPDLLGTHRDSEQECFYSNYRRVGSGLMLPSTIRVVESSSPAHVLPFGPYYILAYALVKASPAALPPGHFTFEGQVPSATIVQSNAKSGVRAIKYVPGQSLSRQFEGSRGRREREQLLHTPGNGGRVYGWAFGSPAVVAALCGWFFYKRSAGRRGRT